MRCALRARAQQLGTFSRSGRRQEGEIPFEQIKPDYLLWGCFRLSFASSSTPAGCLLQLKHGLDEAARGAKSG
jgi:hypothetical protein